MHPAVKYPLISIYNFVEHRAWVFEPKSGDAKDGFIPRQNPAPAKFVFNPHLAYFAASQLYVSSPLVHIDALRLENFIVEVERLAATPHFKKAMIAPLWPVELSPRLEKEGDSIKDEIKSAIAQGRKTILDNQRRARRQKLADFFKPGQKAAPTTLQG